MEQHSQRPIDLVFAELRAREMLTAQVSEQVISEIAAATGRHVRIVRQLVSRIQNAQNAKVQPAQPPAPLPARPAAPQPLPPQPLPPRGRKRWEILRDEMVPVVERCARSYLRRADTQKTAYEHQQDVERARQFLYMLRGLEEL